MTVRDSDRLLLGKHFFFHMISDYLLLLENLSRKDARMALSNCSVTQMKKCNFPETPVTAERSGVP